MRHIENRSRFGEAGLGGITGSLRFIEIQMISFTMIAHATTEPCMFTGSTSIEAYRAGQTIVIISWRFHACKLTPNFKIPNIYSASWSGTAVADIVAIVRFQLSEAMVWVKSRTLSQEVTLGRDVGRDD